jgi:hypothetical protein
MRLDAASGYNIYEMGSRKNAKDFRGVEHGSLDSGVAEDSLNIESLLTSRSAIECSV